MSKTARPDLHENPKSVLRKLSAARLRRARQDDRTDEAWWRKVHEVWATAREQSGLVGFDLLEIVVPKLPPHPPGWFQRRQFCNRCGERIIRNEQHDAYYCPGCLRWIEPQCGDSHCPFCSRRPRKPPAQGK